MEEHVQDPTEVKEGTVIQPPQRSLPRSISYVVLLVLGAIYLINPGLGIVELIPDNMPVIGNLDEAGVASLMVLIIQRLRSGH
ncbi:MAG: DUF1232 domain-containing protein [Chloroflexaceae bacterium]|nr:DUF1232 domain-containing protein [Chloroflexaceae bacterium]